MCWTNQTCNIQLFRVGSVITSYLSEWLLPSTITNTIWLINKITLRLRIIEISPSIPSGLRQLTSQPSFEHRNIFCLPPSFQVGVISPITPMLNLPRLTREVSIPSGYNFVQDIRFWKFSGHRASLPSHFRLGIFTSSTNSYNVVTTRLLKGKETLFKVIQIWRWCVVNQYSLPCHSIQELWPISLFISWSSFLVCLRDNLH